MRRNAWILLAGLALLPLADYWTCLHPPFMAPTRGQTEFVVNAGIAIACVIFLFVTTSYLSWQYRDKIRHQLSILFGVLCLLGVTYCIVFFSFTHELPDHCHRAIGGWAYTSAAKDFLADPENHANTAQDLLAGTGSDVEKAYTPFSLNCMRVIFVLLWVSLFGCVGALGAGIMKLVNTSSDDMPTLSEADCQAIRTKYKLDEIAEANAKTDERVYRIGDPRPGAKLNIVFIHGVDGHWRQTWEAGNGSFWPAWLAEDMPTAEIWSVHYNASTMHWKGSTMSLLDRAENIIFLLKAENIFDRPTVLIVHSYGGLVTKNIWRMAIDRGWADITNSVKAVFFLATPHTGARLADYMQIMFIKAILRGTVTTEDLRQDSPQLRNLNDWYRNHPIVSNTVFFETQPVFGNIQVVDAASANPGLPNVYPVPINADHISICKPTFREDPLVKQVSKDIQKIIDGLASGRKQAN
jgi:triacylglycerol esterase/lipase EstA (alpha/beta hydrolase family)